MVEWRTCSANPSFACQRAECANGCVRMNAPALTSWPMIFQRGCICPPTSEQTCMNPECGRKPHALEEK